MDDVSRRRFLRRASLVGAAATAGCVGLGRSPEEQVAQHRDALSRYRDVATALADGFRSAAVYVQREAGVLGAPFVNPNVGELDPETPQVLLYDVASDGTYELLGVKWFRPVSERDEPPTLFGRQFDGPLESRVPSIPDHYGLTAWLFAENPEGVFARYNPAVEPGTLVSTVTSLRAGLREYVTGRPAVEDGYTNTETCVETERGFYGVPFAEESLAAKGGTDRSRPPMLLYRLTPQWSYQLVGVEWYVPVDGTDEAPAMFGFDFHDPTTGHGDATGQPEHYGLHAWLFEANPRGLFAPFNPALSCG